MTDTEKYLDRQRVDFTWLELYEVKDAMKELIRLAEEGKSSYDKYRLESLLERLETAKTIKSV